jgi:predicted Zn-dependent protease
MPADKQFEIHFFESILRKSPKDVAVIELLGGLYTSFGRIDDGLKMDRRLVRLQPDNPTARYNLACSLALKRRSAEAVRVLRQALELGYGDFDWMLQDPDLYSLKKYPAFRQLLAEIGVA